MECIHCGVTVHPKRVEILSKRKEPITCLEHSQTEKVVGHQVNEGKSERFIEVCTPTQGKRLKKMGRKGHHATGGPGKPVFGREAGKHVYKGPPNKG